MTTPSGPNLSRRSLIQASGALALTPLLHNALAPTAMATSNPRDDEPSGTAKFLELMGYVDRRMDEMGVPSVGVAVVNGDKRHTCALGVTSVDDPQLVDAETMFRIGPLSRLFTGSAIGALVESGAMDLNAPVRTYLPSFTVLDPESSNTVTMTDLLTHQTGWQDDLALDGGDDEDALSRYVESMASLRSVVPPGVLFGDSNADGILTGHVIAEVSGLPFEAAMRKLVLSPLSMDQSSFLPTDIRDLPVVHGHTRQGDKIIALDPLRSAPAAAPVSGLFTNLNEILQFASFHAFASTPPTFLKPPMRETIHQPLGPGGSVGPIRIDAMGVSWMICEFAGTRISVHAGSGSGHSAMIAVVPSAEFAVVVLTNAEFAQDLAIEIAFRALDLFPGLRNPSPASLARPAAELQRLEGTYAVADGSRIRASQAGTALLLESIGAGDERETMIGDLTFVSPFTAMVQNGGSTLFVDFVLDHDGEIGWLRHMGQLAARIDT